MNALSCGAHIRWRSRRAKGMCSAVSECTQSSSEAAVLLDLTTKSTKRFRLRDTTLTRSSRREHMRT